MSLAQPQVLELYRSARPKGRSILRAVAGPPLLSPARQTRRAPPRDRRLSPLTHGANDSSELLVGRRTSRSTGKSPRSGFSQIKRPSSSGESRRGLPDRPGGSRGNPELGVDAQERVHPQRPCWPSDARQSLGGRLAKIARKIGHGQNPIRLGHLAGKLIVVLIEANRCAGRPGSFSMWPVRSASRWSMWLLSVQMRLDTS